MPDYPDWTRLFHLVGTNITIPISIDASNVTLPISIDAVTVPINVTIASQWFDVDVNIAASEVTIDVNITAAAVTLNINFADQSVAVFDAAKWFSHQAQQVFIVGAASVLQNNYATLVSYTVPAGKNLFVVGASYRTQPLTAVLYASGLEIVVASVEQFHIGGVAGQALSCDTPLRYPAGTVLTVRGHQYSSMASLYIYGMIWGYLEAV